MAASPETAGPETAGPPGAGDAAGPPPEGRPVALAITGNLFFLPRIEAAAEACGMDTLHGGNAAALLEAAGPRPIAIAFLDLELDEPVWAEALAGLTQRRDAAAADGGNEPWPIVAYGPHGEPETLRKARAQGAAQTLIKRDFAEQLPTLLAAAQGNRRR